jgi:hypothetical protein
MSKTSLKTIQMRDTTLPKMLDIEIEGWKDAILKEVGSQTDSFEDLSVAEVIMGLIELCSVAECLNRDFKKTKDELHIVNVPIVKNLAEQMQFDDFVKTMGLPTANAYYDDFYPIDPFDRL